MIPLSIPHLSGNEWTYVKECLDTGWISSSGSYVTKFEQQVASFVSLPFGVACMNGTVGLQMALRVLGVTANDAVIVPNITFVASVNAISYTGAQPILIDVDPDTWQMDLDLLEKYLTEDCSFGESGTLMRKSDQRRIAAIMPVHVLGNMCNMERLQLIAKRFSLKVVEDSTEALGSTFNGQPAGTFSDIGVFSFNGNKIISTGGGGVIVTKDEELARKVKHLSTTAKPNSSEYYHDEVGYNYRLVNILAAVGVAQMEKLDEIIKKKKYIDKFYREELSGLGDITFQKVLPECDPNCWLFTMSTCKMRPLLDFLNENGVQSRPFWVPMNRLPMFESASYISEADRANNIFETCISIPSSAGITDEELRTVVSKVKSFFAA